VLTLEQIAFRYRTDKNSSKHNYIEIYGEIFAPLRQSANRVVEIGVYKGQSLMLWERYFKRAHIYGLDNSQFYVDRYPLEKSKRVTTHLVDQSSKEQLLDFSGRHGLFDVVIDDASHSWSDQIGSFETLWPFLVGGGIYVIEDVYLSYSSEKAAAWKRPSTVEYFNRLIDEINCYGEQYWSNDFERSTVQKEVLWILHRTNMIAIKKRHLSPE
jgi:hypothetical protein